MYKINEIKYDDNNISTIIEKKIEELIEISNKTLKRLDEELKNFEIEQDVCAEGKNLNFKNFKGLVRYLNKWLKSLPETIKSIERTLEYSKNEFIPNQYKGNILLSQKELLLTCNKVFENMLESNKRLKANCIKKSSR